MPRRADAFNPAFTLDIGTGKYKKRGEREEKKQVTNKRDKRKEERQEVAEGEREKEKDVVRPVCIARTRCILLWPSL